MKFKTAKLSSISLAIAYSLYSYNVFADASNHISTKGDQVINMPGIDITDDYYSYYTDGSIDMTVTGRRAGYSRHQEQYRYRYGYQ